MAVPKRPAELNPVCEPRKNDTRRWGNTNFARRTRMALTREERRLSDHFYDTLGQIEERIARGELPDPKVYRRMRLMHCVQMQRHNRATVRIYGAELMDDLLRQEMRDRLSTGAETPNKTDVLKEYGIPDALADYVSKDLPKE